MRSPRHGEVVEVRTNVHQAAGGSSEPSRRELEARVASLERSSRSLENEQHTQRKQAFLDAGLQSGRIATDEVEGLSRMFDAAPEQTMLLVAGRPADARVAEANEMGARFFGDAERHYIDNASARFGLSANEVL